MSGRFAQLTIRALDSIGRILPRRGATAAHLRTGSRGEEEAYFYLRRQGYVMIARNYRTARSHSELDMVGWEGETLCFVEVKTRSSRGFLPAESAVDYDKRRDLSRVAREFLRQVPGRPPCRFDVVSVYLEPGRKADIVLFKNAFSMA
ncbi:MAG TPA: YraN family protein [Candidatus Angelobacter sp.]|jgi:putative endonuclease|nr:YraN family protein [Candidatus Angelobacter sp.]